MNAFIIIVASIIAVSSITIDICISIHFNIAVKIKRILIVLYIILIAMKND